MNFKPYNQNQLVLFPHSFDDLISSDHPVRIVNDVLDNIKIDPLLRAYSAEGNPSYHPRMMLKVMVFAYMDEKNLEKYEEQEEILGDRGSYSKTDPDATFMRMKEDHMKNGQLKPAYNPQISTENQFILNYTIHQNTNDTGTLQQHLENFKESYGEEVFSQIEAITTDAGYGSEENYEYLEENGIDAYVKYNTFDKEQDQNYQQKHKTFSKENLHYNEEMDFYVCPMGQRMEKTHESSRTTKNGFEQKLSHYQAKNCEGCPIRSMCHGAKNNRSLERNHNLERYKEKARELLKSEEGIKKRKKRCWDMEPVFAQLKHNHNFKRFTLKSLKKVEIEFGLHALAHNLRKKVA